MRTELSARNPIRKPSQLRSRESLLRIYDATNELLKGTNFDQVTIAQISEQSRVSVGSIYQRFGSKDNLLWALYDSYLSEASDRVASLVDDDTDSDLRDRLERIVAVVCELFWDHRGIIKSLLLKYRQTPELVPESYLRRIEEVYEDVQSYIKKACPPRTSQKKVQFCFSLIMAACREHVLFWEFRGVGPTPAGDREFARLLSSAALGVFA
jgi:AcrR family transcriptional regulator